MNSKPKVFIMVTKPSLIGGIANYYRSLRPYLSDNISYFIRGSRGNKNMLIRLAIFFYDILRFILLLLLHKPRLIIVNTSVGALGMKRDSVFFYISKILFKIKTIVFFRGWDSSFFANPDQVPEYFHQTFMKADTIIVLAKEFKDQLTYLGYTGNIVTETTTVDDTLLNSTQPKETASDTFALLFMSRMEKNKGIYELIDAVTLIRKTVEIDIILNIAGDGTEYNRIKNLVNSSNSNYLKLHGFVKGSEKSKLFAESNLFVFPSYHNEGMPNVVLEAMAFGLPVLTTDIGGISDFFEDEIMGLILKRTDPDYIAGKIKCLMENPDLMKSIAEYNSNYAKNHFYASAVARRLESIIDASLKS
jgi:glycosyltransferase involved in cell wall biosynthesis